MKPYYEHAGITIYHGDCRNVLPLLGEYDLVFADPPYGVGLNYLSHDDSQLIDLQWFRQCRQVSPVVIVTPGYLNLYRYPAADYVLIRFDRTAQSPGRISWMNKWEPILVYGKPKGKLAWDVIETAAHCERAAYQLDHPCPKPVRLLDTILAGFESTLVVDPFCGTGTTLRAAKDIGRPAIGIEIEERYCEIAAKRLAQEVLPLGDL